MSCLWVFKCCFLGFFFLDDEELVELLFFIIGIRCFFFGIVLKLNISLFEEVVLFSMFFNYVNKSFMRRNGKVYNY